MHPWVMAELAQALVSILRNKAYKDHGLRTIDRRLDMNIRRTIIQHSYEAVIRMNPPDGGESAIRAMSSFARDRGGWIDAAAYLVRNKEVVEGDEHLRAWLASAKERLQADQSLDMRLFLERAVRENVRWDLKRHVFFTEGPKYEAYTVFDDDVPYVLRWQQGDRCGCMPLDRNQVPDWRSPPKRGSQMHLFLRGRDAREFAELVNWKDTIDFVLQRDGEDRMAFSALLASVSGASWATTNMEVLDLEEVHVCLIVCHQGDGYDVLSMESGEVGTLPPFWTGYRLRHN